MKRIAHNSRFKDLKMKVDQEKIRVGAEKVNAQRMLWRYKEAQPAVRFFDYLVIIDFEATCWSMNNDDYCQEIIQFPAVLVDVKSMSIKDEFCQYVKPVVHPKLSDYCTNLTGITQDLVENATEFEDTLRRFEEWMLSHQLGTLYKFTIVTDGCYDLGRFLYRQCQLSSVKFPIWAGRWMNIRKTFCLFYHLRWFNLRLMVEILGQEFEGTPHNGKDDALNIAKVVICLLQDGSEAIENERILLDEEEQQKNADEISKDPRIWFGLATVQTLSRPEFLTTYKAEHGVPKHCKSAFNNHDSASSTSPYSHTNNNNNNNYYSGKENINNSYNSSMNIMDFSSLCNSPPKSQHDYLLHHRLYSSLPPCGCSSTTTSHPLSSCVHRMQPTDHHHHQPPFMIPPHQLYLPHVHFRHQNSRNHLSDHYMNVSAQDHSPPPRVKRAPGMLRRAFEASVSGALEKVS